MPIALPQTSTGALTGALTALPPRIDPFPLVTWTGPETVAAEAIAVPGMANAALSTATFITPAAHGDIFITAPVLVVVSHLHRLAGVPERAVPCRDRAYGAARDTVQTGLSGPVAPVVATKTPSGHLQRD